MSSAYTDSGVDIDAGNKTVSLIKEDVASTHLPAVITGLGSFGALFNLKEIVQQYDEPILVQSIDGVGTKLSVAKLAGKFDTVGEDIVNHSVNDILVMGAKPLTFLDYVAHDKLDPNLMADIVKGMCKACRENNLSLVGGETAEMPGTYQSGEHDIAGAITGIVDKAKVITGDKVKEGDLLIAIESSGLHTNGYSLARKVLLEKYQVDDKLDELDGKTLAEVLLKPHLSYAAPVLEMLDEDLKINSMAHITGGGFYENIPRALPSNLGVEIDKDSWQIPAIFALIQKLGDISFQEMYRVFNMGIGLVLMIDPADQAKIEAKIAEHNFKFFQIGQVVSEKGVVIK